MTPEQIIAGALDLIKVGWCQRALVRPRSSIETVNGLQFLKFSDAYCATGALCKAVGALETLTPEFPHRAAFDIAIAKVAAQFGVEWAEDDACRTLMRWNDDPDRTQADVIAAFEKALTQSSVNQILDDVIALLKKSGWCQKLPTDENGALCLLRAFGVVESRFHPGTLLFRDARNQVRKAIGTNDLDRWNDAEGRTFEDVLEALEKAKTP